MAASRILAVDKMKSTDRVQKKWVVQQLQRAAGLKTLAGMQKSQKAIIDMLLPGGNRVEVKSLRDATADQIMEIFGLKFSEEKWELCEESQEVPLPLCIPTHSLCFVREAFNRIAIDYLIVACKVKHSELLSGQSTDDSLHRTPTTAPILDQASAITESSTDARPTTPFMARPNLSPPLPIRVFPEMALSVQVTKGCKEWTISGIADWALGYGERAELEDGTVMIAVEAKRTENLGQAEAQLLAYLATIRQLRIQAKKTNVMTQGFYSDGWKYTFVCIRNDGSVMFSTTYNLLHKGSLKTVFNFLLSMLDTAAKSSPHTSPTKPGPKQDKEIQHFDRNVFVKVFEAEEEIGSITPPIVYHDEPEEEWPDIPLPLEEE